MRAAVSLIASFLMLAASAQALELRSLQTPVELNLGWNRKAGGLMQFQLEGTPRFEFDISTTSSLVLSARLRLDAREQLEPGEPSLDNYATASEPLTIGSVGTLELRDFYWEQRFAEGIGRFGKQQIVWGRLDGIKVLDVLNPQNFREFILDELGESRIGLWSAYIDLFLGSWRVEAALLPDYTAHETPESGAWFELNAPRFRFGADIGAPAPQVFTERNRNAINDGALGLRLSRSIGRFDVSALAYSGNDHEPLGRVVGERENIAIEQFYKRRELFGASAETSLGAVALRAEAAYQPEKVHNTNTNEGLQTARADQISAGIAADLDAPFGVLLNLQFLWDEIRDAPSGLIRPERDRLGTVFLRRYFAYETIKVEARWYHSFDDKDNLYKLTLNYDINDNTTVFIDGDWFDGVNSGLFGQFATQDRVVVGIRQTF